MTELHYPGAMEIAMANATRERKKPVPFPDETESKMIQLVSRAENAEARVAELDLLIETAESFAQAQDARIKALTDALDRIATDHSLSRAQCAELAAETIAAE